MFAHFSSVTDVIFYDINIQWNLVYPDTFDPEKISGYMTFPYIWNMTYLHIFFMLNNEQNYIALFHSREKLSG